MESREFFRIALRRGDAMVQIAVTSPVVINTTRTHPGTSPRSSLRTVFSFDSLTFLFSADCALKIFKAILIEALSTEELFNFICLLIINVSGLRAIFLSNVKLPSSKNKRCG